jgi:hypothetical protein
MRASVSCHRCMEPLWFSRTWHVTLPCQVGCSSQECKGKPGPQGLVGLVSLCRSCRSTASSILRDFFWNALPIFCSLSFGFVQRDPATPEIYWFLMILDDFPHLPFRGDMWFSNTPICTAWDQNLGPMLVTGQHHVAPRHRHGLIWWEGMANPEPQQGPWQHNLLSQSPDGFDQSRVFWSLEALDATAPHKKKSIERPPPSCGADQLDSTPTGQPGPKHSRGSRSCSDAHLTGCRCHANPNSTLQRPTFVVSSRSFMIHDISHPLGTAPGPSLLRSPPQQLQNF